MFRLFLANYYLEVRCATNGAYVEVCWKWLFIMVVFSYFKIKIVSVLFCETEIQALFYDYRNIPPNKMLHPQNILQVYVGYRKTIDMCVEIWKHLNFLWKYRKEYLKHFFYNWISLLLQAWWKEESVCETGSWLWCPWCCQQNWHHLNHGFLLILYVILWFRIYERKIVNVFMILILLHNFYHLWYNHLGSVSCFSTLTHAYYMTHIIASVT